MKNRYPLDLDSDGHKRYSIHFSFIQLNSIQANPNQIESNRIESRCSSWKELEKFNPQKRPNTKLSSFRFNS